MASIKKSSYSSLNDNFDSDDGACDERKTLLNNASDDDEEPIFNISPPEPLDGNMQSPDKLESVRSEVRKVTNVMLENVQKVMDRAERLNDLEAASDRLVIAGAEFEDSARRARRNGWLNNLVAKYAAIAVFLSIVVVILVTTIVKYS